MLLTNAQLVLENEIIQGTLLIKDGLIKDISEGRTSLPEAIDCEGDYLLPGLVELHTDNMEKHFSPRPGVDWPSRSAFYNHDAQMIAAGITTTFDALSIGDVAENSIRLRNLTRMAEAVNNHRSSARSDHLLHLRCEVSHADTLERFFQLADTPNVRLVSVMDHSPGQRQFTRLDKYKEYYQGKYGLSDAQLEEFISSQTESSKLYSDRYRNQICTASRSRNIALASHDDATREHVREAVDLGLSIAEFPTSLEAARASHENGLAVLMGSPNVVRGGSHSGNIAAHTLAAEGILDILSSDYVPASLLWSAFLLVAREDNQLDLPAAIRMASATPAAAVGLNDRGRLASGLRGDLIRVQQEDAYPRIKSVWSQGERTF